MAFATMSEDKDEQLKSHKIKEITCFRCKKAGHYTSKCNEELPTKTLKSGSNILIADQDGSTDRNQGLDDHEGQYQEEEEDDEKYDEPYEVPQEAVQVTGKLEKEQDDETTMSTLNKMRSMKGKSITRF